MRHFLLCCRREHHDKVLTFVLLVDSTLAALPLEALPVFSNDTIHAVTRDFSLQMLCNRLKKFTVDEGNWGDTLNHFWGSAV